MSTALDIDALVKDAEVAISAARTTEAIRQVATEVGGKRSPLAEAHRALGALEPEARKELGRLLHQGINGGACLVEEPAEFLAGLGFKSPERTVRFGQRGSFTTHLGGHLSDGFGGPGRRNGHLGILDQRIDIESSAHGRGPPVSSFGPAGDESIPAIVERLWPSPSVRLWRNASKQSTAADTLTLSDSAWPAIGIDTQASNTSMTASLRPDASFPSTIATRS